MNLEGVARLAGVSRSTVSRVLNGDRRVSDEARARVEAVVREQGYQPNAAARSLASRRTRILGLLIPQAVGAIFGDPFFPRLIEGVAEACNGADHDLSLLLDTSGDHSAVDRLYRRVIRGRHLDGVIVAASVVDDPVVDRLQADGFPFVLVGRHPRREMSFVDIDNRQAAQAAVAHLLDHGRRRVAIVSGPANMIAAIDRYAGYVTAHQEAGLLPDPRLAAHADFTRQGGHRAMRELVAGGPDAVFVASDTMAFGAIRALREAERRVPGDVAVMGFDGLVEDEIAQLELSTVEQPVVDLGRAAVGTLLELMAAPERAPLQRFLPTALAVRGSCGCGEERSAVVDGEPAAA